MPTPSQKLDGPSDGERLRKLRDRLGLTQREMARELGVTSAAVALWETGARAMPGPALRLLSLYERELSSSHLRVAPRSTFVRRASTGFASVMWYGLSRMLPEASDDSVAGRVRTATIRRYIDTLGELKGLSMKLGQMMGYMSFLLPEDMQQALTELPAHAPPTSPGTIAMKVDAELGGPPSELFASWEPKPFAVASIGQVHRAVTRSGRAVAVKVQHARIVEDILTDLRHVRTLDRLYGMLFRGQTKDVIHGELRARFIDELDYVVEATNQRELARHFSGRPEIVIPEVLDDLSAGSVLTTSFEAGMPFSELVATGTQAERDAAGTTLWRFYWEAALAHGLFNTDPHPGNFAFREGAVVFYDFGRVKRFSAGFVPIWKRLFRAVLERDRDGMMRAFVDLGSIASVERFDVDYGFKSMVACFLPCLTEEQPFAFDADFVRQAWRVYVLDNVNTPVIDFTSDMIMLHQLQFGVTSVLARLGARVPCRALFLDLLYAPGEKRPAPFRADELAVLGFARRR